MTKKNLMPTIVLSAIGLAAALLLSLINMLTFDKIQANEADKITESLSEVLPEGKNFEPFELSDKYPAVIKLAYKADGGFVFQAEVKGYKDGLKILCGISSDGKIAGVTHIETNETFGLEGELNKAYIGETLDSAELIIATGATPNSATSKAYFEAIKASLQAFAIAGGAEVDIRTPEQITQDNCNAALGTTDVKFTKWFATEVITGVDAVYESSDGRVYVIGKAYVGIKDATVVTADVSAQNQEAALLADNAVTKSTLTEVTKPDGTSRLITKIYKTESGNYVFEAKASGFSAEYGGEGGEEIIIKVSVSAEGKIIDCLTVSHSESKGYGDRCQTEEYYNSWRGVSIDGVVISSSPISPDNTDPGAISGATYTANGYQRAVKAALSSFKILTEGGMN